MQVLAITQKAILIIFLFGGFLLIDRACAPIDQPMTDAKSRHEAAMRDLGKNDYYPVRSPWGNE
jgi:hypothetical protein